MKRMIVYTIYDKEGQLLRYVEVVLESLFAISSRVVVAVNGKLSEKSASKLSNYPCEVFYRENEGFDGGAYKDTFLYYLKQDELKIYDEVWIMNDTFFGPFFPWNNVTDKMKNVDVDFWGLTEYKGGYEEQDGFYMRDHIQSYFIVFKKQIISSECFLMFWRQLEYPKRVEDAIRCFEVSLTKWFVDHGYKYDVYANTVRFSLPMEQRDNVYLKYSYELIKNIHFPILKKKAIYIPYFEKAKMALDYIDSRTSYKVEWIWEFMNRSNSSIPFDFYSLRHFAHRHENIYLYGNGTYGEMIRKFLMEMEGIKTKYIVSNSKFKCANSILWEELELAKNDGIILSMGIESSREVYQMIKDHVPRKQLLIRSDLSVELEGA